MPRRLLAARLGRPLAACLLFAFAALSGCGGSDYDNTGAAPPVVAATGPSAAIAATTTATAMSAVAFDASASTSADGSALSYTWDFGDGQRGNGRTIAHVFAAAGTPLVTLTVIDGAGRSATTTRTVTVAAGAAPAGTATLHAIVKGIDAAAIAGASVSRVGAAGAAAITDASGRADVVLDTGTPLVLKFAKGGFADQFVALTLPAGSGNDGTVQATLRARDAALTLADAHAGGTLAGRAGATITLPPDALVTGAGALVSGAVDIALTPVDVTQPNAGGFPGRFDGIKADGVTTPIVSLGTVEFVLTAAGQKVQLAAGKTATIEIPIYATTLLDGSTIAVGASVPLWSLDEASGNWIQEGTGTVVASAASPSGLALRAAVGHFSWWNADIGFDPYGPKPKCVYDTDSGIPGGEDTFATATICDMLAEFDRGPGALSTRARPLASAPGASAPARIAGFSRRQAVPISGGQLIAVPANWNIAISGLALNGTWAGKTVVNGPVGEVAEVLVKMRPLQNVGSGVEPIAVPFDATRTIQPAQTARYSFSGAALQYAQVRVDPGTASTVSAHVRLMQGATVLATKDITPLAAATIVFALPTDGSYGIEVESTGSQAASFRLRVDLLGGVQNETIAYPFDVQRNVAAFTTLRSAFDVAAPGAISLVLQRGGSGALGVRLLAPDGSVVASRVMLANELGIVDALALPVAGRYTLEFTQQDATATAFRVTGEATPWLQIAPGLDTESGFAMIDLVADRNGKPVVGYVRSGVSNGVGTTTIALRRWTGAAWQTVGSDYLVPSPCNQSAKVMEFAFDSTNAPLIVYGAATAGGNSATYVKRFSAGAWQDVGPSGGMLPRASSFFGACTQPPRLVIDASDRPVVAYRSDNAVFVQRFASGAWTDLAATPSFDLISGSFDLALDPAGTPYFILAANNVATVRKFDAATTSWVGVGANGGVLPQTNTSGLIGHAHPLRRRRPAGDRVAGERRLRHDLHRRHRLPLRRNGVVELARLQPAEQLHQQHLRGGVGGRAGRRRADGVGQPVERHRRRDGRAAQHRAVELERRRRRPRPGRPVVAARPHRRRVAARCALPHPRRRDVPDVDRPRARGRHPAGADEEGRPVARASRGARAGASRDLIP